ncbi:MAG: class I SAM-dependent methyltransferase [Pseudomonadota bacterium]
MTTPDIPGEAQRTDEWQIDEAGLAYHLGQWISPKRSTLAFEQFARHKLHDTRLAVDLGCGAGAATAYLAREFGATRWLGIDYSQELVTLANERAAQSGMKNISFEQGDWFNLADRDGVDGVISLQTLSWLPEFERPLAAIFDHCRPSWIAMSSLFYDGEISCRIEVTEHVPAKSCFYNVYSLQAMDRFCRQHGYRLTANQAFHIDMDLDKPQSRDVLGTYTVRTLAPDGQPAHRLQISGPLLMNWHFVMIERAIP